MNKNVWLHGYASKPTKTFVFTLLSSWFSWMFIKNHIQHIRYNRFEWFWMVLTHPTSKLPRSRGRAPVSSERLNLNSRHRLWPGMHRLWDFGSTVFLLGASAEEPIVSNVFCLLRLDHQWIPWLMICQTLPKSSKITFRKYLKIDNPSFSSHMIDWKSTNHKSMWHFMVLVLLFEHPVSKKNDVWWSTSVQ